MNLTSIRGPRRKDTMGVLMAGIIGATGNQTPPAVVGEGFEETAGWLGLPPLSWSGYA